MRNKAFYLLLIPVILLGLSFGSVVLAQTETGGPCSGGELLGQCIINIYRWALGVAVLIALIMIIVAGYRYITAGGNAQTVASAKEMLTGSFVGLILLFAAVLILRTINPDLVDFSKLTGLSSTPVVPSQNTPINAPIFKVGAPVSNDLVAALGIQNTSSDVAGNIQGGLSETSTYRLEVVNNSEGCKQLITGLIQRGSNRSWGCTEYKVTNPEALPPALKAAVGGLTDRIIVVTGSTFIFDGNWIYAGGGINISIAIDMMLGVYQAAANSNNPNQIPAGSVPGGGGSSVACTLEVFCEDPETGDRYEPGPSGCQGVGYDGPAGTRQVSECLYGGDRAPSCSEEIRFKQRNCFDQLWSLCIDEDGACRNNFDTSGVPNSRESDAGGTLIAVPGINAGSVNIVCNYGEDAYEAASCGAAMSGGFCESWFSNPGCIPR